MKLITHQEQHPSAGQTIRTRADLPMNPKLRSLPGGLFRVDDWLDRTPLAGKGRQLQLKYAERVSTYRTPPPDDGHYVIGSLEGAGGIILHNSELV